MSHIVATFWVPIFMTVAIVAGTAMGFAVMRLHLNLAAFGRNATAALVIAGAVVAIIIGNFWIGVVWAFVFGACIAAGVILGWKPFDSVELLQTGHHFTRPADISRSSAPPAMGRYVDKRV